MVKRMVLFFIIGLLFIGAGMGVAVADPYKPIAYTKVTMLSWIAPTENTDGSTLTNLAGYKVYCSSVDGTFGDPNSYLVNDPTAVMVLLKDVSCMKFGDNYIVLTAITTEGVESEFSRSGYAKKLAGSFSSDSFAADVTVPNASGMSVTIK